MRINLETAKLAKEKGYDESCSSVFVDEKPKELNGVQRKNSTYQNQITRPIQSDLQKWLREVHNIIVEPIFDETAEDGFPWLFSIYKNKQEVITEEHPFFGNYFDTYEENLEQGLQEGLRLIEDGTRS